MVTHIRVGTPEDVEGLVSFDEVAHRDTRRADHIAQALRSGDCFVAERSGRLVGYVVLTHSFYGNGMIDQLYVAEGHRRSGVGRTLVEFAEARCKTPKLFTSTNLSNKPMQLLLLKLGYKLSGYIDNLDPGDPELVYFKRLRDNTASRNEPASVTTQPD